MAGVAFRHPTVAVNIGLILVLKTVNVGRNLVS